MPPRPRPVTGQIDLVSKRTGEVLSVVIHGEEDHYYYGCPVAGGAFRWFDKAEWTVAKS